MKYLEAERADLGDLLGLAGRLFPERSKEELHRILETVFESDEEDAFMVGVENGRAIRALFIC